MINEENTNYEKIMESERSYEMMSVALTELNYEQQQCVTLFYLQKKSYMEISEATGYSMMQVKSHIQNGKRNLKLLIEKKLSES
jgi:RNA polymerase sigma-70 factor (ECF subfamily)